MVPNPQIHMIPTDQFKTLSVSLKFIGPFEARTVNERALLPQILLAATKSHPSKQAMQLRFDTLYGTQVSGSVAKIGMQSVISFSASIVREDLLGRPIYAAVADLFHEILFAPKTRSGRFLKGIVQNEMQLLSDSLEAIYNDKTEYAYRQMRAKMFEGELFANSDQGVLETLEAVSSESLWNAYQKMIREDAVELYVVGDVSANAFADALAKRIPMRPVAPDLQWLDREMPQSRDVLRLVDVDDVKQAKLDIGYRTTTWYDSDNVFAMFVFNTLFGDSEQSVLFQSVREKEHLCYSIQSSFHHNKGFLVVSAGIEGSKVEQTIAAVERERQRIASGDFTEEDLELAKRWLMEGQRRGLDSPTSLIVRHFNYTHQLKRPYDKDAFETYLNAVTKKDVQAAAALIGLDTIHVLTGGTPR